MHIYYTHINYAHTYYIHMYNILLINMYIVSVYNILYTPYIYIHIDLPKLVDKATSGSIAKQGLVLVVSARWLLQIRAVIDDCGMWHNYICAYIYIYIYIYIIYI